MILELTLILLRFYPRCSFLGSSGTQMNFSFIHETTLKRDSHTTFLLLFYLKGGVMQCNTAYFYKYDVLYLFIFWGFQANNNILIPYLMSVYTVYMNNSILNRFLLPAVYLVTCVNSPLFLLSHTKKIDKLTTTFTNRKFKIIKIIWVFLQKAFISDARVK